MFCSKKKLLPSCPNILTPEKIPTFFIPPKLSSLPDGGGNVGKWLQKKTLDTVSRSSPRALRRSASRHVIQVEDLEQEVETSGEENHRTMATSILGSPYLSESPHTRRRESLFHQMCHTHGPCDLKPLSPLDPDHILNWKPSTHDPRHQRFPCGVLDSDTTSSAESSPFSSPLLNRNPVIPDLGNRCNYYRTVTVNTLTRANSLSTEETSSTDTSPNLPTKENHSSQRVSMMHLVPPPIFHLDFICCQERLTKETEVVLSKGGLLRLSFEYVKELGRLRVKLVNVENLYSSYQDPRSISCCVVMYLMPGKLQKQRSTVIRRSKNPIFNEDFYFEGVEKGVDNLRLKMKVINRGTGMKLDHVLGSGELRLSAVIPL
ncbi:C2 calcium-dependent domain-containing protein 4D-like [Anomaloglossus baeobatrachus]|uniref:C2 calcium-dependent domain-containing protein 4D-like n=1 Tax=Anomaloglossus baeobatrachus TaxID=238106 RepID=UPI003F50AFD4